MTAIETVRIMEARSQTDGEVGVACLQIHESFLLCLETDDIGDVQFLQQSLDKVDVKTFRLSFIVEIGIGPQVAGIFINQGILFGV